MAFFFASVCGSNVLAALPVITTNIQPVTAVDVVGSQITLNVVFSGTSPIFYQWQVIGSGMTNNIFGATNTTLTLGNLQLTNTASYRLQASNSFGVVASAVSSLTVNSVAAPMNNIITSFAAQTGRGSSLTNFVPTWAIVSGSLITGQAPSSVGGGNFQRPASNIAAWSFGVDGWVWLWLAELLAERWQQHYRSHLRHHCWWGRNNQADLYPHGFSERIQSNKYHGLWWMGRCGTRPAGLYSLFFHRCGTD